MTIGGFSCLSLLISEIDNLSMKRRI
ncbi:MTRNR2-like [Pan troglodytes]|nr:MTRNR2-like [Pan troglodytes]NP_001180571.1 MTRNR2-like [Pan troglodytes]